MSATQFFSCSSLHPNPGLVEIEVSSSFQIPGLSIIGLPSQVVQEAKERVRSAIQNSGFRLPQRKILVNLSPSSERKTGAHLDFAIALSILNHTLLEEPVNRQGELRAPRTDHPRLKIFAWGELGLQGQSRSMEQGLRPLYAAWKNGMDVLVGPPADPHLFQLLRANPELADRPLPHFIHPTSLAHAWEELSLILERRSRPAAVVPVPPTPATPLEFAAAPVASPPKVDHLLPLKPRILKAILLSEVGQLHLCFLGPKGAGKSHALDWRVALQAAATPAQQVQHQLCRELPGHSSIQPTPQNLGICRRVGPDVRPAALLGSIRAGDLVPGEFSLAHGGILLTDEILEWPRDARECLRLPLEERFFQLSRVGYSQAFPANWVWVAAGNLCPCGGWPIERPRSLASTVVCQCTLKQKEQYLGRLSGPLRDRLDLLVLSESFAARPSLTANRAVPLDAVSGAPNAGHSISDLRHQISLAQGLLHDSLHCLPGQMTASDCERYLFKLNKIEKAFNFFTVNQTPRRRHKWLRVAITNAALDGRSELTEEDLLVPALFYDHWPWDPATEQSSA